MPVADEYAISDTAFRHRVPHVGATVIDGVKFVLKLENREVCTVNVERFAFEVFKVISATELMVNKFGFCYRFHRQFFNSDRTGGGFLGSKC